MPFGISLGKKDPATAGMSKEEKKSVNQGTLNKELDTLRQEFQKQLKDLEKKTDDIVTKSKKEVETEVTTIKAQLEKEITQKHQSQIEELNNVKEQSIKPLESSTQLGQQRIETLKQEKLELENRIKQAEKDRQDLNKQLNKMEDDIHREIKQPLTILHQRDKATREKVQIEYNKLLTNLETALQNSEAKVKQAERAQEDAHEESKASWFFHEDAELDEGTWEQCVREAAKAYDELALFWSYLSRRDALDAVAGNAQFDLEKRQVIQTRCKALGLYQAPLEPGGLGCFTEGTFTGTDPFCSSRAPRLETFE